jgi:hypothetical protein
MIVRKRSADYEQPFAFGRLQTATSSGNAQQQSVFQTIIARKRSADYEQPHAFGRLQTATRLGESEKQNHHR